MRIALAASMALFSAAVAEASCREPPRACVCDFASPSVLDVRVRTDGGGGYEVVDSRGAVVAPEDGGHLAENLRMLSPALGAQALVAADGQRFVGHASYSEREFLCDQSGDWFVADREKVMAAMVSEDCRAAMADAGVPARGTFTCNDSRSVCGVTDAATPVAFVAAAAALLVFLRRRQR